MRIVVSEFTSLDGIVQAPGGPDEDTEGGFAHGGWSMPYFDPDVMGTAVNEMIQRADAMLFGRRTWQVSSVAWPERSGDPFTDRINALPKYVASRTLSDADMTWNSTLLPGDAIDAIRALRDRDGGDVMIYGSLTLVRSLLSEGMVDELLLMIEPILLGSGKRLFPEGDASIPFELISAETTSTGVQVCRYRPATA